MLISWISSFLRKLNKFLFFAFKKFNILLPLKKLVFCITFAIKARIKFKTDTQDYLLCQKAPLVLICVQFYMYDFYLALGVEFFKQWLTLVSSYASMTLSLANDMAGGGGLGSVHNTLKYSYCWCRKERKTAFTVVCLWLVDMAQSFLFLLFL